MQLVGLDTFNVPLGQVHLPAPQGQPKGQTDVATPYNSVQTKQIPLKNFGGDIVIGASANVFIDVNTAMNGRCTGFIIGAVAGAVAYSVNGSPFRTVFGPFSLDVADVKQLNVQTGPLSSCIVQLHGI